MADPKLVGAMEEIKAVLKKHDIAGTVTLCFPGHLEYQHHINPMWSCTQLNDDGYLHILAKRDDSETKEAHLKKIENTIGMIIGFRDAAIHTTENMEIVMRLLSQNMKISHQSRRE